MVGISIYPIQTNPLLLPNLTLSLSNLFLQLLQILGKLSLSLLHRLGRSMMEVGMSFFVQTIHGH